MTSRWRSVVRGIGLSLAWLAADAFAQPRPKAEQLPDLEVSYLGLSDKGSVVYQVANRGNGPTGGPFVAEIYISGVRRDSITHSPLPGLSMQTAESNLARFADCKAGTVRLVLDPQNNLREASKANNERVAQLTPLCAQAPNPYIHPAFLAVPVYLSFSAPAPYVPLGTPYLPPPVEIRGIELKPGGRLVIEVEPKDADVYVDGMRLTSRSEPGFELGLLAGRHRVDVRRAGMRAWSQDVEVPPGGGLLVKVELVDQP